MRLNKYSIIIILSILCIVVVPSSALLSWTNTSGCWTATNGANFVVMWNTTGVTNTWTVPSGGTNNISYLVVAGGGSGGGVYGGGGGAGGYLNGSLSGVAGTTFQIVVGNRGYSVSGGVQTGGWPGGNSSFTNSSYNALVAMGGGGGGQGSSESYLNPGQLGGSGGGGGVPGGATTNGGGSVSGQGFWGGSGGRLGGGGGGGASGNGSSFSGNNGGNGGNGLLNNITGTSTYYAGGGGGVAWTSSTPGSGGLGGGGTGGVLNGAGATNATSYGGGGGGAENNLMSGAGYAGVVIISYIGMSPISSFTVNTTSGPAPLVVSFLDTSLLNSPSSYAYAFKNVTGNNTWTQFATISNPIYTFGPGNFTINETTSNTFGSNISTQITWINVTSYLPPYVSFTGTPTFGIIPFTVQFTDTSNRSPSSWLWDFGDGTTGSAQNPSHIYTSLGTYSVNLTAANAYGSNSMVKSSYIVATSESIANGRQDVILTSSSNNITLYVKDANSGNLISYATVTDEIGNSLISYGNGAFSGVYSTGQHTFTANATGYFLNHATYLVSGNLIQTIYLTLVTSSASTTWYTPKTVSIQMVDVYGNPLVGASVSANYNQTTLPNGVSDLISNYGMNANVANEALNGTLMMNGITDSSGSTVFTMLGTIDYDITVTYGGNTNYYQIYPQEPTYQLKFIVPSTADNIWSDLYANGNTKVWATEPDPGNVTFYWSFQDVTSLTKEIDYFLKDTDLNTIVYTTSVSSPVAGSIYQLNYTVPNVRGKNYIAYVNYTRNV